MKKNLVLIGIIVSTIVLAVLSVLTAIRIKNLGTQPVAPNAPASKPKATENTVPANITPADACALPFTVQSCNVKIQGKVYHDKSKEAPYRVSSQEVFGPVGFRVDYQKTSDTSYTIGGGQRGTCADSCGSAGSFATDNLTKTSYNLRVVLNSGDWEVTEAYLANGGSCLSNKTGELAFEQDPNNPNVGYVYNVNFADCSTKNIWFGVSPKTTASLTPTLTSTPGPSATPTATGAPSATPTSTGAPTPTATLIPGQSACEYLRADRTSGTVPLGVRFQGKGYDTTRIKGFRFTFGDGQQQEILGDFTSDHVEEITHTYANSGTYLAKLEILDNGDHWLSRGECELTINVSALAQQPEPTEIVTLPDAGIEVPTLGGIIMGFLMISLGAALIF